MKRPGVGYMKRNETLWNGVEPTFDALWVRGGCLL